MSKPTKEFLDSIIEYNPITGIFVWKTRTDVKNNWNAKYAGKIAGNKDMYGYIRISINCVSTKAHQLAFFLCNGYWANQIDHDNGIRHDNSIKNLYDRDQLQNAKNRKKAITNTSGYTGVHFISKNRKWSAEIMVNYKKIRLGCYSNIENAILARSNAEVEYGFHIGHGK